MTEKQPVMSEERLAFPYTTPGGHTYHAPTDFPSLSARAMDYLQSIIECWDEDESPPNPLAFTEYAKIAWNEAVRANDEIDRLRAENKQWVEHYANLLISCAELETEVQRLRAGVKEYIEAVR